MREDMRDYKRWGRTRLIQILQREEHGMVSHENRALSVICSILPADKCIIAPACMSVCACEKREGWGRLKEKDNERATDQVSCVMCMHVRV